MEENSPLRNKIVCSIYDAFGILIKFFAHGFLQHIGSHLFGFPTTHSFPTPLIKCVIYCIINAHFFRIALFFHHLDFV